MYEIVRSSWGATVGFAVAVVALVGTQVFGWEWGSGQLLPTAIGVVAAGTALLLLARRRR